MKRRDVLKNLLGGVVAAVTISTLPALTSEKRLKTDDDELDRLVEAGDFIQDKTFVIERPHHFNGKPCYINRCTFYSSNGAYVYANPGAIITNNVFDRCGYGYNIAKYDRPKFC